MSRAAALAAAVTGVQVGAAMVATRFVIDQTGPASLALLRYAIGALVLLPVLLAASRVRIAGRHLLPIALLGVGQFGVLIALLNLGLQTVPAGRAALLFSTMPLLTLVLAVAVGRESPSVPKVTGVLLTVLGVALALGEEALAGGADWAGEAAVLASASCGAVCTVLYRPYLARYPALPVGVLAMLASVAFLAVPAAAEGFFASFPGFTAAGWLAVAFIGISSGACYWLWLWALGRATPTRVNVFLTLSPLAASALGGAFLGEAVSSALAAGTICVALGIWSAHRPVREERRAGA